MLELVCMAAACLGLLKRILQQHLETVESDNEHIMFESGSEKGVFSEKSIF